MGSRRYQRVPAKPESRKAKYYVSDQRARHQAEGVVFAIGVRAGKTGRVLTNFVDKVLPGRRQMAQAAC